MKILPSLSMLCLVFPVFFVCFLLQGLGGGMINDEFKCQRLSSPESGKW